MKKLDVLSFTMILLGACLPGPFSHAGVEDPPPLQPPVIAPPDPQTPPDLMDTRPGHEALSPAANAPGTQRVHITKAPPAQVADRPAADAPEPGAETIHVAQDNWPAHFRPDVPAALPPRVVLLRLPTYAPWTNPIEKAWRKLKQEALHMHPFADDWAGLQAAVQRWLDRHDRDCPDPLRYVGLHPE